MYKAKKNISVYIGGRMCSWEKGQAIDLDKETMIQNFDPGDYESETNDDYAPVGLKDSKKKSKE